MLGQLDPAAPTPRDASEELTAIVEAYRFDANDDFRAGVDIYFRDFHQHLLDSVNYRDELEAWSTFDSTVVAYVHALDDDGTTDTAVVASGALLVHLRDWLGAWLQTHIDLTDADGVLANDLALATNGSDPNDMLTRIHPHVGDFVSVQQGVVGQIVGQKVAEAKLGGFLESGIGVLPEESKQALFPAVGAVERDGGHARGAGARRARADAPGRARPRRRADRAGADADRAVARGRRLQNVVDTKLDVADLQAQLGKAADFSHFEAAFRTYVRRRSTSSSRRSSGPAREGASTTHWAGERERRSPPNTLTTYEVTTAVPGPRTVYRASFDIDFELPSPESTVVVDPAAARLAGVFQSLDFAVPAAAIQDCPPIVTLDWRAR